MFISIQDQIIAMLQGGNGYWCCDDLSNNLCSCSVSQNNVTLSVRASRRVNTWNISAKTKEAEEPGSGGLLKAYTSPTIY
jgi:hypothetical protein